MPKPIRSLDRIKIDSSCPADWKSMIGNDQVRFCEHCSLQVNDLSAMTRQEAMRLVARSRGRLCVRYVQRVDGSPLTGQVPEKLHRIGRRISRIAAGAFSATLGFSSAAAQTRTETTPLPLRDATAIARVVSPPEVGTTLSGEITDPAGALIPGATLTLTNSRAPVAYTQTTGDDGTYRFLVPEAGTYNLMVERPGFAKTEKFDLVLQPNAATSMNLTMEIPPLIEEVEVNGTVERRITMTMGVVAISEPEHPLVKAAYKNELNALRDLVLTSSDVNVSDKLTDTTALAHAVEHANRDMVALLLSAGADVNARNRNGASALMYLGEGATVGLVRDLVAAGANVNSVDDFGATPLLQVVGYGKIEVITELIALGARIDAKDTNGTTILMNAAENEDVRALKLLMRAGLDAAAKNENGETVLMVASRRGRTEAVKALIEIGVNIDAENDGGKTALMYAAGNEDPEITKLLINKGADVNHTESDGTTALMLAAAEGNAATIKQLIAAGAHINDRDEDGETALMRAGDVENVEILLKAGADLSIKDNEGKTALSKAKEYDLEAVVKLLVSRGAP